MLQRPTYLKQLIQFKDNDNIKIITGVRRSGKSVLLMLYRDYLISQGISEQNIIYLNFEDFDLLFGPESRPIESTSFKTT